MRKLILAALTAVAPLAAFGDVLFEQPPTSTDGYFADGISTNGTQHFSQAIADNFTLSANSNVTSITFWGSGTGFDSADLSNFSSFDIAILDSSFNTVFSTNASTASLNPTLTGNTSQLGGDEYKLTLATNVNLSAGDYFLSAGGVEIDLNSDDFVWSFGTADALIAANFFDGNGWATFAGQPGDLSFRIEGTQPVPEPASMAALGLGALALVRRRRNRA